MHPTKLLTKFNCLLWLCLPLLTACGQRGPLYLPEKNSAASSQEQAQAPADEKDEMTGGEPVPDIIPDAVPEPAAVEDDESL